MRAMTFVERKARNLVVRLSIFFSMLLRRKRKFNIGSAGINPDPSWYATDIGTLNITQDYDWFKNLLFLRLDNIMAEHVWEHLTDEDTVKANRNCFKYLKRNGVLRIAVPDGYHIDPRYIDYVRPGGHGLGADDHKILYNYRTIKAKLENVGFKVELLEYWDEHGNFHFNEWDDEGGRISRSKRYDKRNADGTLRYTSLIVDAIKP